MDDPLIASIFHSYVKAHIAANRVGERVRGIKDGINKKGKPERGKTGLGHSSEETVFCYNSYLANVSVEEQALE